MINMQSNFPTDTVNHKFLCKFLSLNSANPNLMLDVRPLFMSKAILLSILNCLKTNIFDRLK